MAAGEPVAEHVRDAHSFKQHQLQGKYGQEVAEHRRILFSRGSGMCPAWKDFRQFLIDLGPAPGEDYVVARMVAGELSYAPGKAAWFPRDRQPVLVDRTATLKARAPGAAGQWVKVRGKEVEYSTLAQSLGVPMGLMAQALRGEQTAEDFVEQAEVGDVLCQQKTPWLPPGKREAFLAAFRLWHMQVQPKFATAATPAFLFLYSALPGMIALRDQLAAAEAWEPITQKGKAAREAHPAWARFCELMTRVEAARGDFAVYRQFSLTRQLDEMWVRIQQAEQRFRRTG
ncbi:MAG: hypothetical protein JO303_02640 [Caulobacteraceae bacterium]|nr:hypothetical protein [Caulobacteraceae bacterium]